MNDEQFETVKKLMDLSDLCISSMHLTPGAGFAEALESRVLESTRWRLYCFLPGDPRRKMRKRFVRLKI